MAQERFDRTEYYKYVSEYLKHLSALSTGAILWITAFWEQFAKNPEKKPLLAIALIAFVVSIVAIAFNYKLHIRTFPGLQDDISEEQKGEETNGKKGGKNEEERKNMIWSGVLSRITWLSFVIGLISLSTFGILNLLR